MSAPHTIRQLVAATNNAHKLAEIRSLLTPDFRLLSVADIGCNGELPETGDTLERNAFEKAQFVFDHYNVTCFADDTGLEVEALNGEPGVYSARYAGAQRNSDDNIDLLLRNLEGEAHRAARFRTVIALVGPGLQEQFTGIVTGKILTERRGSAGFGYDPVFQPDGFSKTMAEMTMDEKNAISHRGRALQQLVAWLRTNAHRL